MVIGNGMIATKFMKYKNDQTKIIFASGVSNSKNAIENNFNRELELLQNTIAEHQDKQLIYFSTCSVYDKSLATSPYVLHKLKAENLIQNNAAIFSIFRVSNVVGVSNNPYTLLNNFVFNILQNNTLTIFKKAYRNLIDIDDVFKIIDFILTTKKYENNIINVANPHNYQVTYIVSKIEKHLNRKASCVEVNEGSDYNINVSNISNIITACNINFNDDYLSSLLKKYYHSK